MTTTVGKKSCPMSGMTSLLQYGTRGIFPSISLPTTSTWSEMLPLGSLITFLVVSELFC